ncbi:MAG: hypothetical protein J0H99_17020, partial [Rhodospirillales bacterium]|nr:hypothetical protein [Rhodospirillales bacterium]
MLPAIVRGAGAARKTPCAGSVADPSAGGGELLVQPVQRAPIEQRAVLHLAMIARAFRGKEADESHRARLRVEIGRLRAALRTLADIIATPDGFALTPHRNRKVAVLT